MAKIIKTQDEYHEVLMRIDALMDKEPSVGTPLGDELELLALLVSKYEADKFPTSLPDPVEAIKFRMEQANLAQRDLVPLLGSRSKVSEILSGKRQLTLSMIRALHTQLGIPAKVLLQEKDVSLLEENELDWEAFPVKEMVQRGWVKGAWKDLKGNTEEIVREFLSQLGSVNAAVAMFRKSDHVRSARKMDEVALDCWNARVVIKARSNPPKTAFEPGTVDIAFMEEVARLSWSERGPQLAQEYLFNHGISLVIEPHLPRTYLDGAALLVDVDQPIIGLSIRHDRIDNFWYCLMHELAHVALHLDTGIITFFDDLDVDTTESFEREADEMAGEALIPNSAWKASPASRLRTASAAEKLASELQIHPAIVAGRMRYEFNSFRILSQLIGHQLVRKCFSDVTWNG